jgi:hypothetical protein
VVVSNVFTKYAVSERNREREREREWEGYRKGGNGWNVV